MLKLLPFAPIAALCFALTLTGMDQPTRAESLEGLVRQSLSSESEEAERAIARLRELGPTGLQAFLDRRPPDLDPSEAAIARWRRVLDRLCQQRDCYASQLYWYTDWERAKAAARRSGKPILSLRLLGHLDEDLSCANSRFFRVAVYANALVASRLRDRVILHWESVRPVPTVTVDFGDGRTLKRTVTGNSIHYLLDAEGRPLDALPGLYGPQAFLTWLDRAVPMARQFARLSASEREGVLTEYHRDRLETIQQQWRGDLAALNGSPSPALEPIPEGEPDAETAGRLAVTKMVVEFPVLEQLGAIERNRQTLESLTNREFWQQIARDRADTARLDVNSLALMRDKNPAFADPEQLEAVQTQFEAMMALDTVRNEYLLHSQIHQWFLTGDPTATQVSTLNDRVYEELFLTPNSDPWMGLAPENIYSAIDDGGLSPQPGDRAIDR
ncbi:hypothetical protein JJD41_19280 [Oxynema sp. CENA135]|uniref:hypothetical protein n=1 Tax=Oxynema sp. CENA135 TaxID=984206 RepID=UPI00190B4C21|nr:hypothetical protein [Oxynema sp. CENA135]MBK4731996.1 hypothetical protein [Oxynema sp. CENA135]